MYPYLVVKNASYERRRDFDLQLRSAWIKEPIWLRPNTEQPSGPRERVLFESSSWVPLDVVTSIHWFWMRWQTSLISEKIDPIDVWQIIIQKMANPPPKMKKISMVFMCSELRVELLQLSTSSPTTTTLSSIISRWKPFHG